MPSDKNSAGSDLRGQGKEAPSLWETDAHSPLFTGNPPPKRKSKFLMISIGVLVVILAVIAGLVFFVFSRPPGPAVLIEFGKLDQVLSGEPFTLGVSFSNDSNQVIKNVKLSVILPDGVSFVGRDQGQRVTDELVGDLGPGSLGQRTYNLIVLGSGNTLKRIEATLRYGTENGSKAEFQTQTSVDVSVGQPIVSLTIDAPESVFSGESFDIKVNYQNNSKSEIKNLRLKIDYPPNFELEKTSVNPDKGNNLWNLGALAKGESMSITLRGSAIGPEKSFFSLSGSVTADFSGQSYSLISQTASVGISSSPLSLQISVNDKSSDYIARLGDNLRYILRYKNNTDTALENLNVKAVLSGELYDFTQIQTDAFLNSITNTVSWSAANTPALSHLEPGQEGAVTLNIRLKDAFPIRRLSDKNYTLKVQAQIESATVPGQITASRTISVASLENKVAGNIKIDAQGYFRDAASGILNAGPYPPRVNQPTNYTIHWVITNYANDVANVQVSAFLQSGSKWTGKVKSNIPSIPVFDSATGKISWNIESLPATKGISGPPAEAIFQIEATPAVNQIDRDVPLLGQTNLQAHDTFVDLDLSSSDFPLTSALPDDTTITDFDRRVKP